ncbi:hypothetical protein EC973_000960 [Apophysomyces ossiformis]|uniref:PX domain-containing protein n=1 Tax=Apophysomyces ossiformis TaxID=679940 RepID=A0A8H7BUC4_9FUNG|nr:hypothetical protein EC973_000960 [Apophysomyces ossiformis]
MNLTPTELHYFKRELVTRQLDKELTQLRRKPDLAGLMVPRLSCDHYPFLSYMFQHFVAQFPLLKSGHQAEIWTKCQALLDELSNVAFETYAPDAEAGARRIMDRFKRGATIALCAGIKTFQGSEETIKLTGESGFCFDAHGSSVADDHSLDVVTVREKKHAEFVIKSFKDDEKATVIYVGRRHGRFRHLRDELKAAFPKEPLPDIPPKTYEAHRETDRILLRSFLRHIVANPKFRSSSIVIDFLSKDPIKLTEREMADMYERAQREQEREEERRRRQQEAHSKAMEINKLLDLLKEEVKKADGLRRVFEIIRITDNVHQLPPTLRKAFEWGRLSFAFALHKRFIVSEMAAENIANLKRTHKLMPYRTIAAYLNFANPLKMVKGVMNLFLAQPLGMPSLFQRIVLANLNEEAKGYQKQIEELERTIDDDILCQKLFNAVYTPLSKEASAAMEDMSTLQQTLAILQNEDIQPSLTPKQIVKVVYWKEDQKAHDLLHQLHLLWTWYGRRREQQILTDLVFRGTPADLLKELFILFYEPLGRVYRAAHVGDSVRDVSSFITDLIHLLETSDGSLQPFMALTERYEQKFYHFVHCVYFREKSHLFDDLINYVDRIFRFMGHGMPGMVDMDLIVQTAIPDKKEREVLKEEISLLCQYRHQQKTQHMERIRHKISESMVEHNFFELLPKTTETEGVLLDLTDMEIEENNCIPYDGREEAEAEAEAEDEDEENEKQQEHEQEGDDEENITDDGNDAFSTHTGASNTTQTTVHACDDSSKSAHTLMLEPPLLTIIPRVVSHFTADVTKIMRMS